MQLVFGALYIVVLIFYILLWVRIVLSWVEAFARDWRPRGAMLVIAETTYTVTDPPIKALRQVLPSPTIGPIRLDLAFLVVIIACSFLLGFLSRLAG